jgi:hypothetical protein
MPLQNVNDFDRKMQQNPVIIQDSNLSIQAASYTERPSQAGVAYTLQGNAGGRALTGIYSMRPLDSLSMSYTSMLFASTDAWNAPRDQRSMAILQKSGDIEMALIEQLKFHRFSSNQFTRSCVAT